MKKKDLHGMTVTVVGGLLEGGNGGVLARCTTRLFWPFTCTAWSARLARFTANFCEHKNT